MFTYPHPALPLDNKGRQVVEGGGTPSVSLMLDSPLCEGAKGWEKWCWVVRPYPHPTLPLNNKGRQMGRELLQSLRDSSLKEGGKGRGSGAG